MNELCENCERERNLEIQYPGVCDTCGNIITSKQPERSKREDDIMYLKCRCGEYKHIFADQIHMDRCGALNTMET